jgi:Matrixin
VAGATFLSLCLWTPPGATAAGPLPTVVTAQASADKVAVGTKVTLSGAVTPPDVVAPRTAVLQLQTGTGWRELGRSATDAAGNYAFAVPTDWYADHVLRVVAPATATFAEGASPLRTVSVTPTYTPRGSASAWKQFDSKARWDPCSVVEYRTNLRRAPKGALKLVNRAFTIMHEATGLSFRRAGGTKKVPFSGGSDKKQFLASGLVVAWTTPKAVRALRGNTAGIGGATSRSVNGGPWKYAYGGVSIDATQKLPAKGFRKGQSTGALLLHEIAHAMGLDHVHAKSQIMYPTLQRTFQGRFEAGDLAGLRAVGAEQGCF